MDEFPVTAKERTPSSMPGIDRARRVQAVLDTREVLAEFTRNPAHGYQRKNG